MTPRRRTLLVRDPPPVTITIREPSVHALSFAPVETIEDPARHDREALAAADGADLVLRRWTRIGRYAVVALGLFLAVRLLVGCTALEAAKTAREVAAAGCALLGAGDGSTASALAVTADVQKALFTNAADEAKRRGADAKTIDALALTAATLAEALRAASRPVVEAGGNAPAKLPPCPVAPAPSTP